MRGRALQAARARLFDEHPLCVECERQGRVVLAQERDHIIALGNGGPDTDDNTQALCRECNTAKNVRERNGHA